MTAARRHTMGAVDAVWLHMDRPENLLVVDVLMWLGGTIDPARLRALIEERMVDRFPVFRMRPAEPLMLLGSPRWEDDPHFDVGRHLVVAQLPAPGGDPELRAYVEAEIREPLDRDHPLWEIHVVQGYRQPGTRRRRGSSVVLARVHHAVADGIALANVLLSLTDPLEGCDTTPADTPRADTPSGNAAHGVPAMLRVPAAMAQTARDGLHLFAELPHLARPGAAADALALAWQVGKVADKLLLGSLPHTPLSGRPGRSKHAVWSSPHDLAAVKAAGRATGATVNDILMTAVGGALAGYIAARGGEPADVTVMVPVNLRGASPLPPELGNRFALVLFPLVSEYCDPATRLARTRHRMNEIKASPETAITFGVLGAIGRTHPEVERILVNFFSAKAVGVLTNVIGPQERRGLGGVPLTGVLGWVPQAADQTLGVCICSYAGTVRIGFRVDASVVTEPELLVEEFDRALADILALGGSDVVDLVDASGRAGSGPTKAPSKRAPSKQAPSKRAPAAG